MKAIVISFAVFIGLAVAGYLSYGRLIQRDFDLICGAFTDGNAKIKAGASRAETAAEVALRIEKGLFHPRIRRAWEALVSADPRSRRELTGEAAAEMGYGNFDCPAMDEDLESGSENAVPDHENAD